MTVVITHDMAMRRAVKASKDEVFIGGVLHEVGQAVLFHADQDRHAELLEQSHDGAADLS